MTRHASRLLRKLERFTALQDDEKTALQSAMTSVRQFAPHENLIHEGKPAEGVFVILEGFACRYKLFADGRRQIVGYLLPGDMCDLRVFMLKRMDHSIGALGSVQVALMPLDAVMDMIDRFPRLTRALWWTTLVEDSITREWVVNVGHRTASERAAHLFCEIYWRL